MAQCQLSFICLFLLILVSLLRYGCCQNGDQDWSLGCYKLNSTIPFNLNPGDYDHHSNTPAETCVGSCSTLNSTIKLAALTSSGICLCSYSDQMSNASKANSSLCLYPLADGFYVKVFPVAEVPTLSAPPSVVAFQEFTINVHSSPGSSCTYIVNFDDGVKASVGSGSHVVPHIYTNEGTFNIKLTAHITCLAQDISTTVRSNFTEFSNVTLTCPESIELTENRTCELSILTGSGLVATDDKLQLDATIADTVIENIGFFEMEYPDELYVFRNGTYVLPFASASQDGFVTAITLGVKSENITVQILSPLCLSNEKPCQGGCIPSLDSCSKTVLMTSAKCYFNMTTKSQSNTNYIVRSEITVNKFKHSKMYRIPLSSPVFIQRGDIIAFHATAPTFALTNSSTSYILSYYDRRYIPSDTIAVSDGNVIANKQILARLHIAVPSILEILIKPFLPKVHFAVNVSSLPALQHEVVKVNVEVQERIANLEIVSPKSGVHYATLVDVLFQFKVEKGTNVTYNIDFGDRTALHNTSLNSTTHVYGQRGNYSLCVNASNLISSVAISQTVMIALDIKNLKLVKDPRFHPGVVGKSYEVSFRLESGDQPSISVTFGDNTYPIYAYKEATNETITATNTYIKPGRYNITVTATGLFDTKLIVVSTVDIAIPVENLTLHRVIEGSNQPITGNVIHKHVVLRPLTIHAKVSKGDPVYYNYSLSRPGETPIREFFNATATITPPLGGTWEIHVTAWNILNNIKKTITVKVLSGCDTTIEFSDERPKHDPFPTNRGNDVRLNTQEVLLNDSCPEPSDPRWSYNWTVFDVQTNERPLGDVYERHKPFLFIKKGILEPGLYRIEMIAVCNEVGRTHNVSKRDTFVKVDVQLPVAIIKGGHYRFVSKNKDEIITFDASTSYDPDVKLFDSVNSGLRFRWTCETNCTNVNLRNGDQSILKVNATFLNIGAMFEIKLQLFSVYNKTRNTSQIVSIVAHDFPTTEIVCRINCLPFVVPTDRLALAGQCQSCTRNEYVNFTWTLYENDTKLTLVPKLYTTSGFDQENLVVKPNKLKRSTEYRAILKTQRNGDVSKSIYLFETSGYLYGGNCEILPLNGTAAKTEFRVKCAGWKGAQFPLTYEIRYQVNSTRDNHGHGRILWYYGEEQNSPEGFMPAGLPEKDYMINVYVEISGMYGENANVNLSVQVKPSEIQATELADVISNLKEVDFEDEPQKLAQQVIVLASVLNGGKTTGDSDNIDDQELNIKLRSNLIQLLSKVKADTIPLIQQTADAIKYCAIDSTQVTSPTQDTAATTLTNISKNLLNITKNPGVRTGQDVEDAGATILSSISEILSASIYTGQDTSSSNAPSEVEPNFYGTLSRRGAYLEEIGEQTRKVVNKLEEGFQLLNTALATKKLVGERPSPIKAEKFDVELSKSWNELGDGTIMRTVENASNSARIYVPMSGLEFFKDNKTSENVFTEVIAFNCNPYTWDVKRSHFLQPDVFSITFRDNDGKEIPFKYINEKIKLWLPNREREVIYNNFNTSKENENFLKYSFEVEEDNYEEVVMIDIKNAKPKAGWHTVYIKFGGEVSTMNYNFKHLLSTTCRTCSEYAIDVQHDSSNSIVFVRDAKLLKSGNGVVSVGLSLCPVGENKTNCDPKNYAYDIYVQTVSCRYWNKTEWLKDGCNVSLASTPLQTICTCNHLTAFSSYIVKPNPITKLSVEDFEQGYVSLIAVVIIFILYFIFLIWARKADRNDCSKVSLCALADNSSRDRYGYEIAIWTGMRRNAGTGSEVTIILSGDKQDTRPRSLVNPRNKTFARGSLEKFFLTTPEDLGDLYCLRVWHDNKGGSWYLSRIAVTDLQTDERYYFICDRWLGVDEDDGSVERLLPVASDEELADFHHLFYSRTKRGLSDTHLWLSVLNRPPQSIFTRVQRLSCCLCIVMTTMFANAMFYQTKSEPTPSTTNFIGSYSFTWDEVYIGIVSSLIIVPINMITLYIFRNVRPKSRKMRRQSKISLAKLAHHPFRFSFDALATSSKAAPRDSIENNEENIYSGSEDKEKLSLFKRLKKLVLPSGLPPWFVYVGWVILVIVTLGSAVLVVLYGMQFGNGRSLQWLLSIFISICEDVFLLQPLKVLLFALGFALILKKPDEGEFQIDDFDVDEVQAEFTSQDVDKMISPKVPLRPNENQLAMMRKARLKERKMFFLIQEIIIHLIFTIVITLVTYGHKDTRSLHLFQHIDDLSALTDKVNSFPMVWNWSRHVLIPRAFPKTLYNGWDVPRYGFLDDGVNNLISRSRLRLLRVKNDSCKIPSQFEHTLGSSLKDYSLFSQDEGCYRPSWDGKSKTKSQWCFKKWQNLDGYPFWGIFTTYSGSGYVAELIPGGDNNASVNDLDSLGWLNDQSRALFVEMTTYNANVNLYTSITLLFEFPAFGGVFYFKNIIPMRLRVYVGGFAFFIFACELVFVLFIAGYFYIAAKKIYRCRMAYFNDLWNVIDFLTIVMSLAVIGVYLYRINVTTELMRRVKDRQGEFVSFQYVTYWNEVFHYMIAIVVALTTVKLTKLMRFNLRISLFGKILKHAKHALAMFGIQFGIVFFAYVMIGVLLFGCNVSQFKSVVSAVLALGRVILGKSQFRELFTADPVLGPLFFFTYVMFVCWILITMFVAILTDAYHNVQDRCFGMSNEYDVVDFFVARLRSWAGFGRQKKRVSANRRWHRAGNKIKATKTFGRGHFYIPSEENLAYEKTGDLMEKLYDSVQSLERRVDRLVANFE